MGRKAPQYTIAFIDADGDLDIATYGDDLDGAKEHLATLPESKAKLWTLPPVPHRIRREPTVELGEAAPPRKRASRKEKAAPVETPPAAAGSGPAKGNGQPDAAPPLAAPPDAPTTSAARR